MAEIRLAILNDEVAFESFLEDSEKLKSIPVQKLCSFLNWMIKAYVYRTNFASEDLSKVAKDYDLASGGELVSAVRLVSHLFANGMKISSDDLEGDLTKLGFDKDRIDKILETLKNAWSQYKGYLKDQRVEVIPSLSSIHWRVDNRIFSSDYLDCHEVIAIMRLGVRQAEKVSRFTFELNLDNILWLEREIGKMKKAYLKVQEDTK